MTKKLTQPVLGEKEKTVELAADMFSVAWPAKLIAQYVRMIWSNSKRNPGLTKTRSNITGSTRKIYRQKGTGRARHGDIKAPIFVGGGVVHGVTNTQRMVAMPKKMRRKALFAALSKKQHDKKLFFITQSIFDNKIKTKDVLSAFQKHIDTTKDVFFIVPQGHLANRALANAKKVVSVFPCSVNAYRVLKYDSVVFTPESLKEFVQLFEKK